MKRIYHNCRHTKLYDVWCTMKQRCYNRNSKGYKHYGARGIVMCDEWKNNFLCFKTWCDNNNYKEGLTIERQNVNGNYCPKNCCWIPQSEQSKNRTNNLKYKYNGKIYTLKQLSKEFNIEYHTLLYRLEIAKWNIDDAVEREVKNCPLKKSNTNHRYIYKRPYGYDIIIYNKYYGNKSSIEDAIKLRNEKLKELGSKKDE